MPYWEPFFVDFSVDTWNSHAHNAAPFAVWNPLGTLTQKDLPWWAQIIFQFFNQGCFEEGAPKAGFTIFANDPDGNAAPLVEDLPKLAWTTPKEVRSGHQLDLLISPKPHHTAAFEGILGFLDRNGMERQQKALLRAPDIIDNSDSGRFERGEGDRIVYLNAAIEGTHARQYY